MFFINGNIFSSAIDFGCGCMDPTTAPVFECGLAYIQRPLDICIHITVRRNVRIWYCNNGRQVKDDINILDDSLAIMWIAHITGQYFYIIQAVYILQPTPIIEGIVIAEGLY